MHKILLHVYGHDMGSTIKRKLWRVNEEFHHGLKFLQRGQVLKGGR